MVFKDPFVYCVATLAAGVALSFARLGTGIVGAMLALAFPIVFINDYTFRATDVVGRVWNAIFVGACAAYCTLAVDMMMVQYMGANITLAIMLSAQAGADYAFLPKFMEISDPRINDEARLLKAKEFYWRFATCVLGTAAIGGLVASWGNGHLSFGSTIGGMITMTFYMPQLFFSITDRAYQLPAPEEGPVMEVTGAGLFALAMSIAVERDFIKTVIAGAAVVRFALWTPMIFCCLYNVQSTMEAWFVMQSCLMTASTLVPLVVGAVSASWVGYEPAWFALSLAYQMLFMRDLAIGCYQYSDRAMNALWVTAGAVVLICVTHFAIVFILGEELASLIMMAIQSGTDAAFLSDFITISALDFDDEWRRIKIEKHQSLFKLIVGVFSVVGAALLFRFTGSWSFKLMKLFGVICLSYNVPVLFNSIMGGPRAPGPERTPATNLRSAECVFFAIAIFFEICALVWPYVNIRCVLWPVMLAGCLYKTWNRTN